MTCSSPDSVEVAARAIMLDDGCGLTINGQRVFCDDPRALEPPDRCYCKRSAKAAVDALNGAAATTPDRGNYEDRHPNDMVLHPLTEIREWDEALAVLGIQDDDQTPADAIRELHDTIERLRDTLAQPSNHPPKED